MRIRHKVHRFIVDDVGPVFKKELLDHGYTFVRVDSSTGCVVYYSGGDWEEINE